MKRILLNCSIVLLLISSLFVQPSLAKEQGTNSAEAIVKVQYDLPYHGLLPDNPLYFLKTFRDKVVSFLIADPLKKAEFDLLAADKRLTAGVALFEKGKKDLSESTISKGENYFEEGIKNIKLAKKQGRDIEGLLNNMSLSAKKHLEVLGELKAKTNGELFKKFQRLEERMTKFNIEVEAL